MSVYQPEYNNYQAFGYQQMGGAADYSYEDNNYMYNNNQYNNQQQVYYQNNGNSQPAFEDKYKTELCKNWSKTGKCPYNNRCRFAHGKHEIKKAQQMQQYYYNQSQQEQQSQQQYVLSNNAQTSTQQNTNNDSNLKLSPKKKKYSEEEQNQQLKSYNEELNLYVEKYLNKFEDNKTQVQKSRFSNLFKKQCSIEDYDLIFSQRNSVESQNQQDCQTNWDISGYLEQYNAKNECISSSESLKNDESTEDDSESFDEQKNVFPSVQ